MKSNRFFRQLFAYFLRGLLLTIPLTVIVFAIFKLGGWLNGMLPSKILGFELDRFFILLIGSVLIIFFFTLMGWLGSTFLAQPVIKYFGKLLDRAPLLKTFYNAISDLMSTVVGKRKSFKSPVLVKLSENSNVERLGFVTEDDLSRLGIRDKVAVYLPFSYSISGDMLIVPTSYVTPVDAKSADVMKFIVSGGVTQLEKNETQK